jgi:hypothetical protein
MNFCVGVADGTSRIVFGHDRAPTPEELSTMKTDLEARRQKLLGELARVDRHIAVQEKRLARLETQIALASQARGKAA